jgi:hypothetical protein
MAKSKTPAAEPARPYYLPETIDFHALPEAVKLALEVIIEPAYKELVPGAPTTLERSAGVSLSFLLAMEVLDQFELGHQLNLSGAPPGGDASERQLLIARHLRVVGAKQQAARFLLRLQEMRTKNELALAVAGPDQGIRDFGK